MCAFWHVLPTFASFCERELAECTRKLTQAVEELKEKTNAHSALEKASSEKERDFRKAAKAACDALSEYAK